MQPVIGVTSGRRMVTSTKGETRATVLYTTYTQMVRLGGGVPVILTPGDAEEAPGVVDRLDGLLLTGGGDVDPARYGGRPHETMYEIDPLRDEYEIALAIAASEQRLPCLAICRGMQLANVAFGGTLIEDIRSGNGSMLEHQIGGPGTIEPQHNVKFASESAIADALGVHSVEVNSIHHQALRDVAEGFEATAWAPDGTIEAIESADPEWPMWGVQWHPEYLGEHDEPSMVLFRSFVALASHGPTPASG